MGLKKDDDWFTVVSPGNNPMRMLVITPDVTKAAQELVEFASKPENYYIPGDGVPPPGDNPKYVLKLNDFRNVFSITKLHEKLYRHLSVSVPSFVYPIKTYANPVAVWTLAELFGFTGWNQQYDPPKDWMVNIDDRAHCIVVAQAL